MATDQIYREVALKDITPNPLNPRKVFKGPKFDELVESVRVKGVLEPILLRPLNGNGTFELIAGERRFRASKEAKLKTIPALVKDLSDEDAFDVMTIENLQREDLNEYEEALCFKTYTEQKKDKNAVADLAQRIGINEQYIHRRIRILSLPEKVLDAWREGRILYGHCEQLMRLPDEEQILKHFGRMGVHSGLTQAPPVTWLKNQINNEAPEMRHAQFDTKACKACSMNTSVQGKIFGEEFKLKAVHCLNTECFTMKQTAWFREHWAETETAKKHNTASFRFNDSMKYGTYESLEHTKLQNDCKTCADFVSIIHLNGTAWLGRACIGDKACYKRLYQKRTGAGTGTPPKTHGPEFQDRFYRERIPAAVSELPWEDWGVQRMTLLALLSDWTASNLFIEEMTGQKGYSGSTTAWDIIAVLTMQDLQEWIRKLSLKATITHEQIACYPDQLTTKHRIAHHFGVNIAAEWRLHEEYLKRKTIAEIMAICRELKILEDPKVKAFAAKELRMKTEKYEMLKKKDLIRLILESGIELAGKVPAEILKGVVQ